MQVVVLLAVFAVQAWVTYRCAFWLGRRWRQRRSAVQLPGVRARPWGYPPSAPDPSSFAPWYIEWSELGEPGLREHEDGGLSVDGAVTRSTAPDRAVERWLFQLGYRRVERVREYLADDRPEVAAYHRKCVADGVVDELWRPDLGFGWWRWEAVIFDPAQVEVVVGDRPAGEGWSGIDAHYPDALPAWVRSAVGC